MSKPTDLWRTPPEVFGYLDAEYNFVADMACSDANKLCAVGYTEADDSLSFAWADKVNKGEYVFCNPPYSKPLPWVRKAIEASQQGVGVAMLTLFLSLLILYLSDRNQQQRYAMPNL